MQGERIYFSTGDYEEEAGIWYWDGKNIHRVLSGGQQRRAVDFLICDDGLYYGTDTPVEKNYIYKVTCDGQVKRLQAVSGSVFYMSEQAGRFWLATVVEPSVVNKSRTVELWSSCQRDKDKWVLVDTFTKDVWSMKYFQYGQIIFPYVYAKVSDRVWFYVQGVKGSGKSILKHMN